MHISIFFEQIFMLRNPISSAKVRTNFYLISSSLISLLIFFAHFYFKTGEFYDLRQIAYYCYVSTIYIFALYIIMTFLCILNLFYSCKRLGFKKFLLFGSYNNFLIRQFLSAFLYILCYTPFQFSMFNIAIKYKMNIPLWLDEVGLILFSGLGFSHFFFRVSDTKFYTILGRCLKKTICCKSDKDLNDSSKDFSKNKNSLMDFFFTTDEPLTNLMSKMMNLEFMCCVLYGMKYINFKKCRKAHKETSLSNNNNNINLNRLENIFSVKETEKYTKGFKDHKFTYQKLFSEEEVGIDIDNPSIQKEIINNRLIEKAESLNDIENKKSNPDCQMKDTEKAEYLLISNSYSNQIYEESINKESSIYSKKTKNYDAVITEYCPQLFADLRKEDNLDYEELIFSLDPYENKQSMLNIKESLGKSGSFFFFTHDKKFIIKTVKEDELNTMLGKIMENYYLHIMNNPDSLLTRIYGLYTITIR